MEKNRKRIPGKFRAAAAEFAAGLFRSPVYGKAREYSLSFILGLLLSRTAVFGSSAPFGIAATAAFSGKASMLTAALGALTGFISASGRISLFKSILGLSLYLCSVLILKRTLRVEMRSLSSLLACASYLTAELAAAASGNGVGFARAVSELLLVGCSSAVFKTALERKDRKLSPICVYCMITAALASFRGIPVFGGRVSIGHIAGIAFSLSASQNGGMYSGAVTGLVSGLIFDITGMNIPVYTAALGSAGLVTGLVKYKNRIMPSVLFVSMTSAMALLTGGGSAFACASAEAVAASVICILMRKNIYERMGTIFSEGSEPKKEKRIRNYVKSRLSGLAGAYDELAVAVERENRRGAAEAMDPAEIYETACEYVCSACRKKSECWAGRNALQEKLDCAGEGIIKRGHSIREDFEGICAYPEIFASYVNLRLCEKKNRILRQNELEESRRMLGSQYEQISRVLDVSAEKLDSELRFCDEYESAVADYLAGKGVECEVLAYYDSSDLLRIELCGKAISGKIPLDVLRGDIGRLTGKPMAAPEQVEGSRITCISFREEPPYECRLGASAEKKYPGGCSGDSGTYFYGDDGKLYIVLCDGMGSGENAARLANGMIRYMQYFLKTGTAPDSAAEIVNSAMLLKNEKNSFSTADISVIDPATSELTVVKCGAAESYIRRNGRIMKIGGEAVLSPGEGLDELLRPRLFRARLEDGDILVMGSDGAFCGNESKIEGYIKRIHSDDPKELADILLKMTHIDAANDDRTVIAAAYTRRKP